MMFRFSCFSSHIHCHKQKKTVHISSKPMHKVQEDCSSNQSLENFNYLQVADSPGPKPEGDAVKTLTDCGTAYSVGCECKSEEMEKSAPDYDMLTSITVSHMKKSQSLASGLDMKAMGPGDIAREDEMDQQFCCDESPDNFHGLNGAKDSGASTPRQSQEVLSSDGCQINGDGVNHDSICSMGDVPKVNHDSVCSTGDFQRFNHVSICSMGDVQQSEKEGLGNSDCHLSGLGESFVHRQCTPAAILKSVSLPNIDSPGRAYLLPRCRSAEDLSVRFLKQKQMLTHEGKTHVLQHLGRNDEEWNNNEKNNFENQVSESYGCVGSSKNWIIPEPDEVNEQGNLQKSSLCFQRDELPNEEFKVKRIEEWVFELQHCCSPLEESNGFLSEGYGSPKSSNVLDVAPATRMEGNISKPSMEAVKKYISSLSGTCTAAQLVNHGLVVIPFFGAFSSLRAINLSGNAIVRITAGALPRGLHVLNLSKNSISVIEGLRELTRLRVLDLSYNRLLRIGHGLASCSSLKELYLAGNKISEVEGLHRLLKLNVLDLRFNKISITKCLGQLAANYASLQAISLEGNPAQKNVGDEQLKKYLQGLLPHLAYLNRLPTKSGTLKDTAERSARLGMSAHQIERSLKSDLKAMRKTTHSSASQKLLSSSHRGGRRSSQLTTTPKPSKGRHVRPLPNGARIGHQLPNLHDFNSKHLPNLKSELSMRRSRSEGTLARLI